MSVAEVLQSLAARRQGLASTRQLLHAGVTRSRLSRAVERGEVVRIRPRVYGLAPLPALPRHLVTDGCVSPEYLAHVRAALLSLGPDAVAAGRTAAVLFGWPLLVEPTRAVEVAVPHGRSHVTASGVLVRRHRQLALWERTVVADIDPIRMTSPMQTIADCARTRPLVEAVVLAESALRLRHVELDQLRSELPRVDAGARAARVRRVASLVRADSGSVPESVLSLRMIRAGLDFRTQHVILGRHGRYVLRADFCFPEARLVVEVDGARWHADGVKDQRTDNALAEEGWRVLRFSGVEVLRDASRVVDQIRTACDGVAATSSTRLVRGSAA